MKRYIALALAAVLALTLVACKKVQPGTDQAGKEFISVTDPEQKARQDMHIWISLPDEMDEYWAAVGQDLQQQLENLLYQVHIMYAGNDPQEQATQLEHAINEGADCLIVAAVDAPALEQVGELAHRENICVVAYDRMWTDTRAVDYFVANDYAAMGALAGGYVSDMVDQAKADGTGPLTVELFMGSPENYNSVTYYQALMQMLRPHLESGALVCKSGRTALEDVCVVDMDTQSVERALALYLDEYYEDNSPDVICTADDRFAEVCIQVLEQWGVETMPIITGIGGGEAALTALEEGRLTVTFPLNMQEVNDRCVQVMDAALNRYEIPLTHPESCFNNVKTVPANLCPADMLVSAGPPAEEKVQ